MKKNYKKILLFISLLPYIIFLLLGIIDYICHGIEDSFWDLYIILEPIARFWVYILDYFNIFIILPVIFFIGYPIYYILDARTPKKEMQKEVSKKSSLDKSFILYIISFIPYSYIIYSVIFGIEFGFFSTTTIRYGIDAFSATLILGTIIPIYPLILIFQVIYTIKRYKFFTKFQKILVILLITSILLLIIIPSIIYSINNKNALSVLYNQAKFIIQNYL